MRMVIVLAVSALVLGVASPVSASTAGTEAVVDAGTAEAACEAFFGVGPGVEPLSACQWGMRAIQAGPASYANATGAGVSVGVIDGGVDITHADVAPNLDLDRSCSFIFSDTPTADPAEVANGDCSNKSAVQDLQGHGTHVASIIAGADNGIGVVGVAPEATIVALKACTVEGFCFADSVAAALRYAGDQRLDVVNLSLFADPWLYFCNSEAEQRAMLQDLEDAARYAQQQGVVIVAAAGNESDDLGHPTIDDISPDWPPDTAEVRDVRNNCRVVPA
jgi:subtilisin family serine protease